MKLYANAAEHIEELNESITKALGVKALDKMKFDLSEHDVALAMTVGDITPIGFNDMGQEKIEIEFEYQVYVSGSRANPQGFAASLSCRLAGLLAQRSHGREGQAERPKILGNYALPNSKPDTYKSYCVRSVMFTQVVYVGDESEPLYNVVFTGVEACS